MKVRLEKADAFYYPDVTVVCDRRDKHPYFCERPSHIIEVISPDTERVDRGEKSRAYREIPGIKAYVILEQDRMQATVLRPGSSGWTTEIVQGSAGILRLPDLDCEIPLSRIYERTSVANQPNQPRSRS